MTSLGSASVKAVKWSAISTVGRFALQLIAQVVLARILGPENYGLFGIGMVVYTFGNFFSSFGFGRNLLQKQEVTPEDIRFAFTWQMITGGCATIAILLLAPSLTEYFNEPRVLPVIQWLSLACLFNAATAPANNLLQRDLNFKTVGLIQIVSYALGYLVIGIPLALAGYEVFALVAAWLTQTGSTLIGSYWARPHPVKPLFWFHGARTAVNYGGIVFLTNIINWLLNNLDRVVIARILNAQAVGLYTAGYNLATMPNTLLLGSLQTTFLASGAKLQTDRKRLGESYLQVISTILVIFIPAFVFLASISSELVNLLYGPDWKKTAQVLSTLFLGMPAFIAWGLSTPVLWNGGKEKYELLLQLPILVVGTWALFEFSPMGITAVAITTIGILALRGIVMVSMALKIVEQPFHLLLPELLRGIALSCLSGGIGLIICLPELSIGNSLLKILISSTLSTLALISIIKYKPGILGDKTQSMLHRFIPNHVPAIPQKNQSL